MTLPVYHLRRLLAATAVLLTAAVLGMYIYARLRVHDVRKQVPNKIGYEIKQTANGFQFSKSDGQRTLFSVQASSVKEFKLNGRAELHNVNIIVYGRDSSRYDKISGQNFSYDPKSGDVSAQGEVQIDLAANPEGASSPDQGAPQKITNTIHLNTRDLVFNKDTGNAVTTARVEFSTPQASGWAVGAAYAGKSNSLTLASRIHVAISGERAAVIEAWHGVITNEPRTIVLDHPHLDRQGGMLEADRAVFHLSPDNNVERILAEGSVVARSEVVPKQPASGAASEVRSRADQAELVFEGDENLLRTMTLTGNVHVEQSGPRPMEGDAGSVVLRFVGDNELQSVHAAEGTRIAQIAATGAGPGAASPPQNYILTSPIVDFTIADGNALEHAETSGAAKITITSAQDQQAQTAVTAGKFIANFTSGEGKTYPTTIHGSPDARIVSSVPGQPDRVSTSDSVDAVFRPQGGIESVTQTGNIFYTDNQTADKRMQAWASHARYTPADRMLMLTGAPRVTSGAMATTAQSVRINRATGEADAETDVKSTYSDVKEQPGGALLASSSPIHATARRMIAENPAGVAVYSGNARLWQDANIVEAPTIQFDREQRSITAQGTLNRPVLTTLAQAKANPDKSPSPRKSGKGEMASESGPITITSRQLTYMDSERKIHYEGGVLAKGSDFTATCKTLDGYLRARGQESAGQPVAGPSQLDHMVALGDVLIRQATRRAQGEKLVYTAGEDKFVLTGGPPSIFDAEHGRITGVSLTFFRHDDRVLVEGEAGTPVVTQTKVAP